MRLMNYIWQHPAWPVFSFDRDALTRLNASYERRLGQLGGEPGAIPQSDLSQIELAQMVDEAVANAAIEGEMLSPEDVRSSIITQLGLDEPAVFVRDQRARGMAALQILNRQEFSQALNIATLHEWQRLALRGIEQRLLVSPVKVGRLREATVQIVSGPIGREIVHYEGPPAPTVAEELERLVEWFNRTAPGGDLEATFSPIARAAITHFWFEAIHPYDDGNGRVGRALAEKSLMQNLGAPLLFSLSTALSAHRESYYRALGKLSTHHGTPASATAIDCTGWVTWFGEEILWSMDGAGKTISFVLNKARYWRRHRDTVLNDRQRKALDRLFAAGHRGFTGGMTATKYMNLTHCAKATATRDLADLTDKRCLEVFGSGRSVRYGLAL